MICPNCKRDMIVVEHHRIELDYCTNCQGVWFDYGELELLLQLQKLESPDLLMGNILSSPATVAPHKRRRCPICGRGMKEVGIGQPPVHIDACRRGDGLWFDGGELHQLLGQLAGKAPSREGSQQQIIAFLGDVFKAASDEGRSV